MDKFPSQRQFNIDCFPLIPTELDDLTKRGRVIARDLTEVVNAYNMI